MVGIFWENKTQHHTKKKKNSVAKEKEKTFLKGTVKAEKTEK